MTLSTTKQLMEPVRLDTKLLDASNLALSSGAAAASEYVSRYNDELARKGSNIDKSIAQTMRRTLGRTNLAGSVIIESSEVMTAVSSADQKATFVQSFGVVGSVIGGLLGGAIFGILGAAASPVVGALAVGVGVGLGGFVGEELAEGVARSLFDFLDDDTDGQADRANTVAEAEEKSNSEDVSSEMEVSQHVSIGFNDTLDFASIARDSEGLAETEENPAATPSHALVDPLTIQEGEAINPQRSNQQVIDRLSEILNQENSLTTGAKQTFSPTYAGDILFNEAASTSPTQTPTYANDYLENLNTLEPASSTRDVTNDINDYIDEIAFDDPGFGAVQGSAVGRAETAVDITYDDPGYINLAFSSFDFSDTYAGASTYGGDFDFDGYSGFDAGYDSGDDAWGGGADVGDGPGDSFLPVVLDLNGDGARILELNDSPAWFDFGEDGFVRRLAWADPNDAFLVYDADGDGTVNGPEELSFVGYLPGAATDLEGLAAFDSSGDGTISSDDIEWSKFAMWQDANSNGLTDEGELSALSDTNIASVTLASDELIEDYEDGSRVFGRGMFTRTDNTTHDLADVALAVSGVAVGFNEDLGSIAFRSESLGRFEVAITNDSLDVSLDVDAIKAFVAGPNDDKIQSNGDHGVLVFGAAGHDTLTGSGANDWLFGGEGADSFEGNDGDDLLFVDAADMSEGRVAGGPGVDIAVWDSASPALVEISSPSFEGFIGSAFNDEVRVSGSASMLVEGLAGDDLIFGGSGDDVLIGGAGADVLDAGAGDDWLFIDSDDVSYSGGDGFDTLVVLDGHSVEINGRQKSIERFFGADGDDVVRNRFSRDSVEYFGGGGNDRLIGGSGDDYISGGTGNDKLDGGSGLDTAVFDAHAALFELNFVRHHTLKIEGSELSGQGRDRLKRFEIAEFADRSVRIDGEFSKAGRRQKVHTLTDGDDVLQGNQGSETVSANGGNDLVIAAGGDDVTNAGMGDDVVFGGAGQDRIRGEQGDDYLVGGAGDDVIEAGLGDDTIAGGEGDDWLSLGEGVDTALIFTKSGQDTLVLGSADAAERNVIEFVDASYEELWFERDGNNELRVSVLGTDDTLTVEDWFASESHASTIRDANGREVDAASVHHLITAMATFETSDSEPELASFYSSIENRSGSLSAYWELNSSLS